MNINMSSIMGKVHRYADSDEGQRMMRGYIIQVEDNPGRKRFSLRQNAGTIINTDEMESLTAALIRCLINTAKSHGLPPSIIKHFESLEHLQPTLIPSEKDIEYSTRVYFEDGLFGLLHRDSLYPEKYDGVDNIIALFNNGYNANNHVWGLWVPAPEDSEGYAHDAIFTASKKDREGLHFIQEAIDDFNGNYGYSYGAIAYLPIDSDYK